MVIGVDAFDWLPWPKILWARPERLSLDHRGFVNIYAAPDEIESEIKKSKNAKTDRTIISAIDFRNPSHHWCQR